MKKQAIIRAAVLAALSITAIILGIIAFAPQEQDNAIVVLQPVATPEVVHIELAGATDIPIAPTIPPTPTQTEKTMPAPIASPTPRQQKEGDGLFTLRIKDITISVAYGVEEKTLEKTPGWLTTSVLPGEDGMCVVYGHRNRNHLKVLENVVCGDTITVTMDDGMVYTYTISDITIYDNTADLRLPTLDGRTLLLVTCYPFRYSGHAPGKYVVTAHKRSE